MAIGSHSLRYQLFLEWIMQEGIVLSGLKIISANMYTQPPKKVCERM